MQLKAIKLAGFKSFVDPTTLLIRGQRTAIVGPNGCGKSNIIDAVCWVMGESSAKYLRGESLTDVIFNGSTARKPVGQASIELIFDNQDGSAGGEYAKYAEISIRRQMTRDGESVYFLNGSRCRRRDILDIFLGTGLGPRSYAIIGQNMIARIVDAKPDDMRAYLEEAAGISKYKERRRETENRIHHTQENMARLNDIRMELDKQLATLQRQANAAEKFKQLKAEERQISAEWHAIQWRTFESQLAQCHLHIQQHETAWEASRSAISHLQTNIEQQKEVERERTATFQETQRQYYVIGNEITRLEQDIAHHREREQQWKRDHARVLTEEQQLSLQLNALKKEWEDRVADIARCEPECEIAKTQTQTAKQAFIAVEESMQRWQVEWDEFNRRTSQLAQQIEVEKTRIQQLEQRAHALHQRHIQLCEEERSQEVSLYESQLLEWQEKKRLAQVAVDDNQAALKENEGAIAQLKTRKHILGQRLRDILQEQHRIQGEQASLQALQQAALGKKQKAVTQWLEQQGLHENTRLAEHLQVEPEWEKALEKVLGNYLQAVCVDQLDEWPYESLSGTLSFFEKKPALRTTSTTSADLLLSKVQAPFSLAELLAGIYVANTLEEARQKVTTLAPHESIITKDGIWLGACWLRMISDEGLEAGLFQREQALKKVAAQCEALNESQQSLQAEIDQVTEEESRLQNVYDVLRQQANACHAHSSEIDVQLKHLTQRVQELKKRGDTLRAEQEKNQQESQQVEQALLESQDRLRNAQNEHAQQLPRRDVLSNNRELLRTQYQSLRDEMHAAQTTFHQLEVRLETNRSQEALTQQTIQRLQNQIEDLSTHKVSLENEKETLAPSIALEEALEKALNQRITLEKNLNTARNAQEQVAAHLKQLDTERQWHEKEMNVVRDQLESLRVEWQGFKIQAEAQAQHINDTEFTLETLVAQLPEDALQEVWHEKLQALTSRIQRLGAINLVAIEEYATCSERKTYLDAQYQDLQEGLAILEDAISKIDKETRLRFKETFDQVNERFQSLFPQVFAGGRAYLQLTDDNLLESGVSVMACPPGKRNSTIHLLSGGEKTMTAIALVFSIFYLNPAPFCLLDEVDAALDDANVSRFCELVKSMSEKTQFIFISHNKLAIEMGECLMGVTMHEPGVSRLVSVDVKEALSLADA